MQANNAVNRFRKMFGFDPSHSPRKGRNVHLLPCNTLGPVTERVCDWHPPRTVQSIKKAVPKGPLPFSLPTQCLESLRLSLPGYQS